MAEGAGSPKGVPDGPGERFLPAQYQPPLPLDRLILKDGAEGAGDRTELDVLIVGAGPAGLPRPIGLVAPAQPEGAGFGIGVPREGANPGGASPPGRVRD